MHCTSVWNARIDGDGRPFISLGDQVLVIARLDPEIILLKIMTNIPPEMMLGVYCDESSQVQHVRLADNDLFGTIPSERSLLSNLQVLELENNTLKEFTPTDELGQLTALKTFLFKTMI